LRLSHGADVAISGRLDSKEIWERGHLNNVIEIELEEEEGFEEVWQKVVGELRIE